MSDCANPSCHHHDGHVGGCSDGTGRRFFGDAVTAKTASEVIFEGTNGIGLLYPIHDIGLILQRIAKILDEQQACREASNERAERLDPYRNSEMQRPSESEPLARFLFGIRYYAGMLEDDDNWSHGLGHIEELCIEFDKAIHERAGKPYLPRDERLRADLQSWFDAAQMEKKRASELEKEREHLLFGCAEAFVRFDAQERARLPLAVHQREWLAAERIRLALVAGEPRSELKNTDPDPRSTKTAALTPHQRKCPGCRPGAPAETPHSKACYLS